MVALQVGMDAAAARAQRRFLEMRKRGISITLDEIAADLERRDARDTTRKDAPLVAAPDAVVIDTSEMGIDDAFAASLAAIEQVIEQAGIQPR